MPLSNVTPMVTYQLVIVNCACASPITIVRFFSRLIFWGSNEADGTCTEAAESSLSGEEDRLFFSVESICNSKACKFLPISSMRRSPDPPKSSIMVIQLVAIRSEVISAMRHCKERRIMTLVLLKDSLPRCDCAPDHSRAPHATFCAEH